MITRRKREMLGDYAFGLVRFLPEVDEAATPGFRRLTQVSMPTSLFDDASGALPISAPLRWPDFASSLFIAPWPLIAMRLNMRRRRRRQHLMLFIISRGALLRQILFYQPLHLLLSYLPPPPLVPR